MSSGQKAKTLLELVLRRYVTLHDSLEFVAGVEGNNIAGLDRDGLAGTWVAPRAWRFSPDVEVAESRHFDVVAGHQRRVDQLEECFHHVLGFAFVQAETLEQQLSELGLRQRRSLERREGHAGFERLLVVVE